MLPTTTILRTADRILGDLGFLDRPVSSVALMKAACNRTGLSEFGEEHFTEPLQRFLNSTSTESALSTVGRVATRWDVLRFLSNLLRMRQAEKDDPGVQQQEIISPIFITGLPRSGTTFLHRLMMCDPRSRAPRVWETIFPFPISDGKDRRLAQVSKQLRTFERLAPEFRALHPLDATSPQECSEITAHVFRSLRFDTNYRVPLYRDWLGSDESRSVPAMQFHKRFLKHLQHRYPQDGRQWVLKCPEHVFTLNAIRSVYPDAKLVFVHRDPIRVLLSVAKLTEVLRRPFTREIDVSEIGRQESSRWLDGTAKMMAASDQSGAEKSICHVHYAELVSNPLRTVQRVYQRLGIELPVGMASSVQRYVSERPNGGYGPRAYRFEDHGLNQDAEREKFQPYLRRFGVSEESGSRPALRKYSKEFASLTT